MNKTQRLCRQCQAPNDMEDTTCHACGADITPNLPVPLEPRLPVAWKGVKTSLTLGVGALALRGSIGLAKHILEKRGWLEPRHKQSRAPGKVSQRLARREETYKSPDPRPQVRVWGRRVWGKWERDGNGQVEVQEFYWQEPSRQG